MSNQMLHFVRREGAEKYLAFRVSEWFDASASEARFGVQAQVSRGKWCHIAYQGAPLIFRDRIDAADEVLRLRKSSKAKQAEPTS